MEQVLNTGPLRSTLSAADRRIVKKASTLYSFPNEIIFFYREFTHTYELAFDVDGRLVKNCNFTHNVDGTNCYRLPILVLEAVLATSVRLLSGRNNIQNILVNCSIK